MRESTRFLYVVRGRAAPPESAPGRREQVQAQMQHLQGLQTQLAALERELLECRLEPADSRERACETAMA